jgi:hypothetical protein
MKCDQVVVSKMLKSQRASGMFVGFLRVTINGVTYEFQQGETIESVMEEQK